MSKEENGEERYELRLIFLHVEQTPCCWIMMYGSSS